ncbi:hypothetical protein IMCC26134_13345 [Verrucomicrobia bacterium IMCC26134]|jgi:hypothetical protein|nr:hypothetical protein IMCC26134_13345 [Verrucomicrobia bacterium IMCC26134]
MKLLARLTLALTLQFSTLAMMAQTAPVKGEVPLDNWGVIGDKAGKWTPAQAEGRVTFSGEGFGDKGKLPAAFFPKTELKQGQTLELSAKIFFTGVSGTGNFRFGLFLKRSKDHARGWLGYCAFAGLEKNFPNGGLYARMQGNDTTFDSVDESNPEAAPRLLSNAKGAIQNIRNGAYHLTMSLKRTGKEIECTARLVSEGEAAIPAVEYAAIDSQPATYAFDTLGFSTRQVLSVDVLEFSDVKLSLKGD